MSGEINQGFDGNTITGAGSSGPLAATVPGAYPYTTLAADKWIDVDTTSAGVTVLLLDGSTVIEQVISDASYTAGTNNITVGVANAAKKMNGTVNGTVVINQSGAKRLFRRDTNGQWSGGV
jgi:hypothetical protein